jgi:hypothetical protein
MIAKILNFLRAPTSLGGVSPAGPAGSGPERSSLPDEVTYPACFNTTGAAVPRRGTAALCCRLRMRAWALEWRREKRSEGNSERLQMLLDLAILWRQKSEQEAAA